MAAADTITVSVVYCPAPHQADEVPLQLPAGSVLSEAVLGSGILQRHGWQPQDLAQLQVGIWGRVQSLDTVLRERDRIEIYRPLKVDPKEARRLRYGQHKATVQARKERLLAAAHKTPFEQQKLAESLGPGNRAKEDPASRPDKNGSN